MDPALNGGLQAPMRSRTISRAAAEGATVVDGWKAADVLSLSRRAQSTVERRAPSVRLVAVQVQEDRA